MRKCMQKYFTQSLVLILSWGRNFVLPSHLLMKRPDFYPFLMVQNQDNGQRKTRTKRQEGREVDSCLLGQFLDSLYSE